MINSLHVTSPAISGSYSWEDDPYDNIKEFILRDCNKLTALLNKMNGSLCPKEVT